MVKSIQYEELVHLENNKYKINDDVKLTIDCNYEAKKGSINFSYDILSKLMGVKNQGGFRYIGSISPFNIKYVILYVKGDDEYWPDSLDIETGVLTYYGDNKYSGTELHSTYLHGNEILRDSFAYASSDDIDERKKVPVFFVFKKGLTGKDFQFLGLAVPGNENINPMEWLVALWASRRDKTRFQNYRAKFTILDTSRGSQICPNDANIDIKWLNDIRNGNAYDSKYAPYAWKEWVEKGKYTPLTCIQERRIRKKQEQLPEKNKDKKMLKDIYEHFKDNPYLFEKFAIDIVLMLDDNILDLINTRPTKDGGKDGEGIYRIGEGDSSYLFSFVIEAKCYEENNSVGVKETSRLISRIKHREFGVFVTTSYVAKQAYEEIIEDNHPILIVAGNDIVTLLKKNGISNSELLKNKLNSY